MQKGIMCEMKKEADVITCDCIWTSNLSGEGTLRKNLNFNKPYTVTDKLL